MDKQQFLDDVALERTILHEGVPMASLVASSKTYVFEAGAFSTRVHHGGFDARGGNIAEHLRAQFMSLFFAAAWKVLDLAIEHMLPQRDRRKIWTAQEKKHAIEAGSPGPSEVPEVFWRALTVLYTETIEIRHALVHRRAEVSNGAVHAKTKDGAPLPVLSHMQLKCFCELVRRMADAIEHGRMTQRQAHQCQYLLFELRAVHRLNGVEEVNRTSIARVQMKLGTDRVIPVSVIKAGVDGLKPGWTGIDFVVDDEATGATFTGELEHVTDLEVTFDPSQPPVWLQKRLLPRQPD